MMNHDQEIPSKFNFWYITCPGRVQSSSDFDTHVITSDMLLRLYSIPPTLRGQVWNWEEFQNNLAMSRMNNPHHQLTDILTIYGRPVLFLKPQVDGDYSWEKLVLKSVLERL